MTLNCAWFKGGISLSGRISSLRRTPPDFLHFPADKLLGEFPIMTGHVRIGVAENKNQLEFFFEKELIIVHSSCFVITFLYVLVIAMYINMKIFIKFDDAFKSS